MFASAYICVSVCVQGKTKTVKCFATCVQYGIIVLFRSMHKQRSVEIFIAVGLDYGSREQWFSN